MKRGIKFRTSGGILESQTVAAIEDLFGGCGPSIFGFSNRTFAFSSETVFAPPDAPSTQHA